MSAELLREAAAKMRERAEAATPGPWVENVLGSEGYDVRAENPDPTPRRRRLRVARCGYEAWETDKANAEHIASWHPAVALAVADWLDSVADSLRFNSPEQGHAHAVARAYLGRDQ